MSNPNVIEKGWPIKGASWFYFSFLWILCVYIGWLQTLAFLEVIHGAIGDLEKHGFVVWFCRNVVIFCVYDFRFWIFRNCPKWCGASSDAMGWEDSRFARYCSSYSRGSYSTLDLAVLGVRNDFYNLNSVWPLLF